MSEGIAIIGMACCYPEARGPRELWENVLACRRAFRRLPAERLSIDDYFSTDVDAIDKTYSIRAAVIEGYEFDRARFRVAGSTFRQVDMSHWLALDMASQAIADAGFPDGHGLPKETTGVLVGNSLTGEFSRANIMRLRWPYVRRVIDAELAEQGWEESDRSKLLANLEDRYKSPFPPVGDETLAGGLSNTIAGRICNQYDLHGGGFTVDGACASSLLAVSQACSALIARDVDVVIAGGVDLSLDPFELVGFAKVGALADSDMRVYDRRSAGFWPGEGCGIVVLMRQSDAVEQRRRVYATIRGWGISSDGSGGLTRPEIEGQQLALRRAYRRCGFSIDSVEYFEGHGTGTTVGDSVELRAIDGLRKQSNPDAPPAAIGSVKANIGHTKAAAGVAGLIKATMALHEGVIPPNSGVSDVHRVLEEDRTTLEIRRCPRPWNNRQPARAAVSAMGFGGINAHVVLQSSRSPLPRSLTHRQQSLMSSYQDTELFLFSATSPEDMLEQIRRLESIATGVSLSELSDIACGLSHDLRPNRVRAAVIASTPDELGARLGKLSAWLEGGVTGQIEIESGVMVGCPDGPPTIGFVFPGQGSPSNMDGGIWRRRFSVARDLYQDVHVDNATDSIATEVAQPAIIRASITGLRVLQSLDLDAHVAIGHSLGELAAYHWAGAYDEATLLRLARSRGAAMADRGNDAGAMASIAADRSFVESFVDGETVVIAGLNSPRQTVVSGESMAVESLITECVANDVPVVKLPVSHAFHSPLMNHAVEIFRDALRRETCGPLHRFVVSTISGNKLSRDDDLKSLMLRQFTSPVRLCEAIESSAEEVDLWIEVGPGSVLSGILRDQVRGPIIAVDSGGMSLTGLLNAVGCAFVLGGPIDPDSLFRDRLIRPFDVQRNPKFFANACESAPAPASATLDSNEPKPTDSNVIDSDQDEAATPPEEGPIELVRKMVAARAELPRSSVSDNDRLLSDLHLNSITVGQLVADAARQMGVRPPSAPTDFANATVAELAVALEELSTTVEKPARPEPVAIPPGVDSWVRLFAVQLQEQDVPVAPDRNATGQWQVFGADDDPLRRALKEAIEKEEMGNGIAVCMPEEFEKHHCQMLLDAARQVNAMDGSTFLLVDQGSCGASFARTLYLEYPAVDVCVIHVPPREPHVVGWIISEAKAVSGFVESHYDSGGIRRVPVLGHLPEDNAACTNFQFDPGDLLLVTGGGKGIAAECALDLAKRHGVRLALVGRSSSDDDALLRANLRRMREIGANVVYVSADVTDPKSVRNAVQDIQRQRGPITAVIHGAGANRPKLISALAMEDCLDTLAPKVDGIRNILASIDGDKLRLLVSFGSIIAESGMPGEAHYALANECLGKVVEDWERNHPNCHCVNVEWSVWSGVGMGERLGRIDALKRSGISPITSDEGIHALHQILTTPMPTTSIVATNRFGDPPTIRMQRPPLPLQRFLERVHTFTPGVELVVDAKLSEESDPYIGDHVHQGVPLLPAVVGLEAMAQAAAVLSDEEPPSEVIFENVRLHRPIVVPNHSETTIRVAALARKRNEIEVVVRSDESGFQADHFRALCRVCHADDLADTDPGRNGSPKVGIPGSSLLPLDPPRDLYGGILFHSGRFQRVVGFRQLEATRCIAEVDSLDEDQFFGAFTPAATLLGDPAARDAVIHAIQACIPHGTLLPAAVQRIRIDLKDRRGPFSVRALEVSHSDGTFVYDVQVIDQTGRTVEQWQGLELRRVDSSNGVQRWAVPLLAPLIQRRIDEVIPGANVRAVVRMDGGRNGDDSEKAIVELLGHRAAIRHRVDGKPETNGAEQISISHAQNLTLAVGRCGEIACDIEQVTSRSPSQWRDLLGDDRMALVRIVEREVAEEFSASATRVWSTLECMKKVGRGSDRPLVFDSVTGDGWTIFASGNDRIATWATNVHGCDPEIVVAVLIGRIGTASNRIDMYPPRDALPIPSDR